MPSPVDLTSFEHDVLLALLELDLGQRASLREKLTEIAGKEYSMGSVSAILKHLEDRGLVTCRRDDDPSGRKKLFAVTDQGQAALKASLAYLDSLRTSNRNRLI